MKIKNHSSQIKIARLFIIPLLFLLQIYVQAGEIQTDVPALRDVFAGDFSLCNKPEPTDVYDYFLTVSINYQ